VISRHIAIPFMCMRISRQDTYYPLYFFRLASSSAWYLAVSSFLWFYCQLCPAGVQHVTEEKREGRRCGIREKGRTAAAATRGRSG